MTEDEIKTAIRQHFGLNRDVRLFTNPVGNAYISSTAFDHPTGILLKHPRRIEYGLCPGSSDLIGWITQGGLARFVALEVKSAHGQPAEAQLNFIEKVRTAGGIAGVVRSVKDVEKLLGVN
jgi:VRR-NUC domain